MKKLVPLILAFIVILLVGYFTFSSNNSLESEITKPEQAISRVEDTIKEFLTVPMEEEKPEQVELVPNPDEVFKYEELPKDSEQEIRRKKYLADKLKRRGKSMGIFNADDTDNRDEYILYPNIQDASLINEIGGEVATVTAPINLTRTLIKGSNIPAILSQEIISNLPGDVSAKVTEDVYAEQGRNILIPKGSKIVGKYKSLTKEDQIRLNIDWSEIITPQGNIIKFSNSVIAADFEGKAGLSGEIDNRFTEKYGVAMLFATIVAASQLKVSISDAKGRAVADSFGKEIGQVTSEVMKQVGDIKKIIRVPKASLLEIKLNEYITFPKPREKVFSAATTEN